MGTYVIALEPGRQLKERISELKRKAKSIAGRQLYMDDEPHITLYLGNFGDAERFIGGFEKVAMGIGGPVKVGISDWLVFRGDCVTGRDTLACAVSDGGSGKLARAQRLAVEYMRSFREGGPMARYARAMDGMDATARRNVEKYGYPFVGVTWKPHVSIASFDRASFEKVFAAIGGGCPKGFYELAAISIYELSGTAESMKLIRRFALVERGG